MKVFASEPYKEDRAWEIRFGIASWDDGSNTNYSVKLAWRDKSGKVCRGGEVPVDALPQMVGIVKRYGRHPNGRRRAA